MKLSYKKMIRILLAAVLVFSCGMMLFQYFSESGAEDSYAQARIIAQAEPPALPEPAVTEPPATLPPEEEPAPVPEPMWVPAPVGDDPNIALLEQLDLAALRQENPDVVGWIRIPGTQVDYPLMQGEDNQFYLNHTWQGVPNGSGSIFLESQNSGSFSDFNTILYGHNMRNGSMFSAVRQYSSQVWWENYPYVYIRTDAGVWRYEIFSSYEASTDSNTYRLSFRQEQTRLDYLAMAMEQSVIDTGITPQITDRLLTLSTCSGMGYTTRWVVHARLPMVKTFPAV